MDQTICKNRKMDSQTATIYFECNAYSREANIADPLSRMSGFKEPRGRNSTEEYVRSITIESVSRTINVSP